MTPNKKTKSNLDSQKNLFAKMTREKYYCREVDTDGVNFFFYMYMDDPGFNRYSIEEAQYRAIRGISEVQL